MGENKKFRFHALDGLRGLMALWVYLNHLVGHCGISSSALPRYLEFVRWGQYAVDVFIIMSGFVISALLRSGKDSNYQTYITRRFFRLYPVYFALLLIYAACGDYLGRAMVTDLETRFGGEYLEGFDKRSETIREDYSKHFVAHSLMVHGAIPDKMLKHSSSSIVGNAWSISLEWQFYLIAPLLILGFAAKRAGWLILIPSLIIAWIAAEGGIPKVELDAFLPFHLSFFLIGIATYFLWEREALEIPGIPVACMILAAAVYLISLNLDMVPVCLWILFLPALSKSSLKAYQCFSSKVLVWLGNISYSVYLSHSIILLLIQVIIAQMFGPMDLRTYFLMLAITSFPAVLIASWILYRYVEVPGIKLGQRIGGRFFKF